MESILDHIKQQVTDLEKIVAHLADENKKLKKEALQREKLIDGMKQELEMKSVRLDRMIGGGINCL